MLYSVDMSNKEPIRIGIIEDDQAIYQMYRMKFEKAGFDVMMADNGETGFLMCEKFRPHLILLDLQMPHVDGEECLKMIRNETWGKDIPVLILTNLGIEEAPESLKELNVTNYIVKAAMTPRAVVAKTKEVLGITE